MLQGTSGIAPRSLRGYFKGFFDGTFKGRRDQETTACYMGETTRPVLGFRGYSTGVLIVTYGFGLHLNPRPYSIVHIQYGTLPFFGMSVVVEGFAGVKVLECVTLSFPNRGN